MKKWFVRIMVALGFVLLYFVFIYPVFHKPRPITDVVLPSVVHEESRFERIEDNLYVTFDHKVSIFYRSDGVGLATTIDLDYLTVYVNVCTEDEMVIRTLTRTYYDVRERTPIFYDFFGELTFQDKLMSSKYKVSKVIYK